jgi:hypothetical protein
MSGDDDSNLIYSHGEGYMQFSMIVNKFIAECKRFNFTPTPRPQLTGFSGLLWEDALSAANDNNRLLFYL